MTQMLPRLGLPQLQVFTRRASFTHQNSQAANLQVAPRAQLGDRRVRRGLLRVGNRQQQGMGEEQLGLLHTQGAAWLGSPIADQVARLIVIADVVPFASESIGGALDDAFFQLG